MRPDPGGHGKKVQDELVDNSRTTGSRPREASVFDDGRLNFVELGIVGWLERQPSRRASIDKLRIIGGGCETIRTIASKRLQDIGDFGLCSHCRRHD